MAKKGSKNKAKAASKTPTREPSPEPEQQHATHNGADLVKPEEQPGSANMVNVPRDAAVDNMAQADTPANLVNDARDDDPRDVQQGVQDATQEVTQEVTLDATQDTTQEATQDTTQEATLDAQDEVTQQESSLEATENSTDEASRIHQLQAQLDATTQEKEHLSTQYRTLLGKLQAMRNSLGEKLREDAEELDRREVRIDQLVTDLDSTTTTLASVQEELNSLSAENTSLTESLALLRSQHQAKDDQETSAVGSLSREVRDLRGDLERLRIEREDWETQAVRERQRTETLEQEQADLGRRLIEAQHASSIAQDQLIAEERRAKNLEDVLAEFQSAKDLEIAQATNELESQLRYAAQSLQEYKHRAAQAETALESKKQDKGRVEVLEKQVKEQTNAIGKLRHDGMSRITLVCRKKCSSLLSCSRCHARALDRSSSPAATKHIVHQRRSPTRHQHSYPIHHHPACRPQTI